MVTTSDPFSIFLTLLISLGILAFSISIHEAAHAWAANRLGDPTAAHQGRISLNPLDHIDPLGTVILPLILIISGLPAFGWAKPTPFNPWNLSNPKRDAALISLAGPLSNLVIAVVFSLIFRLTGFGLFSAIVHLNLVLAVFNLIPIHPLDGFKVIGGLLPRSTYIQWMELERIGPFFLIFFFFFGGRFLSIIVAPLLTFFLGS